MPRLNDAGSKAATGIWILVALLAWGLLAPRAFGGRFDYVVVSGGTSMGESLSVGDLVLVRPASRYRVGDVVAARTDLGSVVVHRMVRYEGSRLVLQGDANPGEDAYKPGPEDVIGRMSLRIPGIGRIISVVNGSRFAGFVVGVMVLIVGLWLVRQQEGSKPARRKHYVRLKIRHFEMLSTGIVVVAIIMAIVGWQIPERKSGTLAIDHALSLSTEGRAAKGATYPSGRVEHGQPFYFSLVGDAALKTEFETFVPTGELDLAGQWTTTATLRSSAGWSREFQLGSGDLSGDAVFISPIDLDKLRGVLDGFIAETGEVEAIYRLDLSAKLDVRGSVSGEPYETQLTAALPMKIDQRRLFQEASGDGSVFGVASNSTLVSVPGLAKGTLSLGPVSVTRDAWWRLIGALAILGMISLLGMAIVMGHSRTQKASFPGPQSPDPWG